MQILSVIKPTKTLIYSSYAIYTHLGKTDSN